MVTQINILSTLKAHKEEFSQKYHLKSLGIFGSFSRDDHKEFSDIDILVDFDQPVGIEFIDLANDLEKILNRKVDLVSRNGVKPGYLKEIEKDLIYV
jgi:predicted nucleotidyltransferase